jgi:hypothetical protein
MTDNFIKPQDLIIGADKILAIYGQWPDMHDFEVPKVIFERELPDDEFGPFITVFIHMWHAGKNGYSNHNIVGIRFNNVIKHDAGGFNHQNVINDITIKSDKDNADNPIYHVNVPDIFGFGATITCRSIEVVSIEPGAPTHSQYTKIKR